MSERERDINIMTINHEGRLRFAQVSHSLLNESLEVLHTTLSDSGPPHDIFVKYEDLPSAMVNFDSETGGFEDNSERILENILGEVRGYLPSGWFVNTMFLPKDGNLIVKDITARQLGSLHQEFEARRKSGKSVNGVVFFIPKGENVESIDVKHILIPVGDFDRIISP